MVIRFRSVGGRVRVMLLLVIVLLVGSASKLLAANATATWNPNSELDIAGYKLSYGTTSGVYSTTVDCGNVTTFAMTLTPGTRFYFALQAYDTSNLISALSAEVTFEVPASTPTPPIIASLTPTSAPVATAVTIAGTNFGATQGTSTVTFSGIKVTPMTWSATSISARVPTGATSGNVVVTVGGVASPGVPFTVLATPAVTSLAPTSALVRAVVTIAGTNFGATQGTSVLTFNGTTGTPTTWSATSIVVPVPAGATTGNVVVTVGGVASTGVAFTVMPTSGATSLVPTSGSVGTPVTITGTSFGATQGSSTVTFNGTAGTPTTWSATSISVRVPVGATSGTVVVSVGGVASPGAVFTVTVAATARARVPNDFDGDGKSDVVVYRPSTGGWYVLRSTKNYSTFGTYMWGLNGDVPVQGDFDGDGRADVAVFRPSNGKWYILLSSTNYTTYATYTWGVAGDTPVPGDYDGDGQTDIAVYRPSNGGWYILQSSTNYTTYVSYLWGVGGDTPVMADYDGDGQTDIAVYRPSNGGWYILQSRTNYTTYVSYVWGLVGDVALPGDYDGDGHADIAVYRPSNGGWYILWSSTSYATYGHIRMGPQWRRTGVGRFRRRRQDRYRRVSPVRRGLVYPEVEHQIRVLCQLRLGPRRRRSDLTAVAGSCTGNRLIVHASSNELTSSPTGYRCIHVRGPLGRSAAQRLAPALHDAPAARGARPVLLRLGRCRDHVLGSTGA